MSKFKELLEKEYDFPCEYSFKFVVPQDKQQEVFSLIEENKTSIKKSRTGKYISITYTTRVENVEHIIAIYERVAEVEGVLNL